jgi:Flp pilus assembly protein TadD
VAAGSRDVRRAFDSLGKTEEALTAYRRSAAAAPASTLALNNLGRLLERAD